MSVKNNITLDCCCYLSLWVITTVPQWSLRTRDPCYKTFFLHTLSTYYLLDLFCINGHFMASLSLLLSFQKSELLYSIKIADGCIRTLNLWCTEKETIGPTLVRTLSQDLGYIVCCKYMWVQICILRCFCVYIDSNMYRSTYFWL